MPADDDDPAKTLPAADQVTLRAALEALTAQGPFDPARSLRGVRAEELTEADPVAELAATRPLEELRLQGPDAPLRLGVLLGSGGMGEVVSAEDRALQREVALKRIRRDASAAAEAALLREAQLTGSLEHPNIVPVHRLGMDEHGRPLMVMKRIAGTSWRDLLLDPEHEGWRALPDDRLLANLEIFSQVCNAVHYAHSKGVLHRDIKPSNVMVGGFGEVYLVDWGLGIRLEERAEAPAGVVGTLAFMSPEQLGEPLEQSERTDVYQLGATLHYVLTLEPRHSGEVPANVLYQVLRSEPFRYGAEVPAELATLCNAATARDPGERPASALALRRRVERFLEHRGSSELARAAEEDLRELEAGYSQGAPESELSELRARIRFGFGQALAAWPGNERARGGLQRCLELTIERELAAGRHALAATLLGELPDARPELAARVEALGRELADQEHAAARLAELEREHDLRVGGRERAWVVGLLAALAYAGLLGFAALLLSGRLPMGYGSFAGFGGLVGLLLLVHLYWTRRWLLSNRVNRTLVAMAAGGWLACMLNVAVCAAYAIPLWILITNVGLLMSLLLMQISAAVDRRLWPAAGVSSLATLSGVGLPQVDPILVHIVVGLAICAYVAAVWWSEPPGGKDPRA